MEDLEIARAEPVDEPTADDPGPAGGDAPEPAGPPGAEGAPPAPPEPEGAREAEAGATTDAEAAAETASGPDPDPAASDADPDADPDASEDDPDPDASSSSRTGPGEALPDDELERRAAALLFASPDPLSTGRLRKLLEDPAPARVRAALEGVSRRLEEAGLPIVLAPIAGGWRLLTHPDLGEVVQRLLKARTAERITPASLETLAIVAYRQPVTSAEIEAIRGVQSGSILRSLVDRGLVRVVGRADQPGAPLQYGTTRDFLDRFGLASLDDLPRDAELAR